MDKIIREHLKAGILSESNSSFCSPAFLVPKPDGTYRMVVDYRHLNSKTVPDCMPVPDVVETLEKFKGAKYFTVLDLNAGYHQLPLNEESRKYTAFANKTNLYEYNVLPMGLTNAPMVFVREMQRMLEDCMGRNAEIYLDDLMVHQILDPKGN